MRKGDTMAAAATFYRLLLDPLPEYIHAINNRKEDFQWIYAPKDDRMLCEINFLQEGSISEMHPDGEHTYPQGTVLTLVHDHCGRQYCKDPVLHEFPLVFSVFAPPEPVTAEYVALWDSAPNEAILPKAITDYATCQQIGNLIKSVIGVNNSDLVARGLRLRTALYKCLAIVTEAAVQQAKQQLLEIMPNACTALACEYIRAHLSENPGVQEIARAAGTDYDRLKRLFRREMNMTILDYVNSAKIRQVEKLITVDGLSLAEAGATVGIRDPDYLSRLFRRCTGITAREYRKVYTERWHKGFSAEGVISDG